MPLATRCSNECGYCVSQEDHFVLWSSSRKSLENITTLGMLEAIGITRVARGKDIPSIGRDASPASVSKVLEMRRLIREIRDSVEFPYQVRVESPKVLTPVHSFHSSSTDRRGVGCAVQPRTGHPSLSSSPPDDGNPPSARAPANSSCFEISSPW